MQILQKPLAIIFLLISLVSLACLQTVNQAATEPPATSAPVDQSTTEPVPAAAPAVKTTPSAIAKACAMISADEALHLRQDPGPEAQVLAFMRTGEVVKLLSTENKDWWLIKWGDLTGYARSRYLKSTQCR